MDTELDQILAELMLYRNDPSYVARLSQYTQAGEVNAQYALGLVYAEGRGTTPDLCQAYIWLCRAEAQGDEEARSLRFVLMPQMTASEIDRAELALAGGTGRDHSIQ